MHACVCAYVCLNKHSTVSHWLTGSLVLCLVLHGRCTVPYQKVNTAFCPSEKKALIFTLRHPRSAWRTSWEDLITLEVQAFLSVYLLKGKCTQMKLRTQLSDLLWPCMYKYSNVSTLRCLKLEVLGRYRSFSFIISPCSVSVAFAWPFGISYFDCKRQDTRSLGGRKQVMGLIMAGDGAFKLILSQWMT